MPEFNLAIIISSFVAGVFTFFAPCTLPLVPAFLAIISGIKVRGSDPLTERGQTPLSLSPYRWRIFKNAIFYVLGFSLIFILFGVSFTFVSQILGLKDWLQRIGGVTVILFGLVLIGWIKMPVPEGVRYLSVRVPDPLLQKASFFNSFLLGALFALGWSPCVGPLLGSVLLLASTSGTILQGAFLLVVFSVGLGLPFLLTALLIGKTFLAFEKWGKTIMVINRTAAIFLIFLGVLLTIGQYKAFHNWLLIYFYRFQFFEVFVNKFL